MAYTTRANIEQYLNTDLSAVDGLVTIAISAVGKFIDNYCNKHFESSSETRYYDGEGSRELRIDPFYGNPTVTTLDIEGGDDTVLTEGQGSDFITYPYNTTEKNTIILTPVSSIGAFPSWEKSVKVVGNFATGASAPNDIVMVATALSAKLMEKRIKGGTAKSESLGDYSVTYSDIEATADELGIKGMLDFHVDIPL